MALSDDQRHRMIRRALLHPPAPVAERSAALWRSLAVHLSAIIGEGGFAALYARSVHLTGQSYPCLGALPAADSDFAQLQSCLQQLEPALAGSASVALLAAFIDTLILLIGELVTTSILRAAWGDDALDHAVTEPQT